MSLQAEPGGPDEVSETCAAARKQIAGFIHESPGAAAGRFLRAHFERCPACEAVYREALTSAARVGRVVREERIENTRERRHSELIRLSRGAGRSSTRSRPWLKLFLATAALFFLFTRLPLLGFGAALHAEGAVGHVVAGGAGLGADERVALVRGDRCLTGRGSRVVLVGGGTELGLDAMTAVLVEEPTGTGGPRVRLQGGALDLVGPCVVTTEFGILTVSSGRGRIELDGGALVSCLEGELSFVGPFGMAELTEGQSAEFGLTG